MNGMGLSAHCVDGYVNDLCAYFGALCWYEQTSARIVSFGTLALISCTNEPETNVVMPRVLHVLMSAMEVISSMLGSRESWHTAATLYLTWTVAHDVSWWCSTAGGQTLLVIYPSMSM
ncbi:uncharacterized protein STEHIDRAFT_126480 [Stereum hirsutum FP-91666 SS1]|uniref:Uncharacterized protein n=1 Tax=Stereum hirsutum (strain FP-91666) TaxID=721885 RepID=R7RYR1_STEHR|nr:uncharacterized protein STEHIDRAFT_126480 [Stereum hirsutum FP-91666 SS1]EIM79472.1 hypothetical protein STEHIDRAFT_126480 [Stereum hirsutum FP-91666 SS1]